MSKLNNDYQKIPAVSTILSFEAVEKLTSEYTRSLVLYAIRKQITKIKTNLPETTLLQNQDYWAKAIANHILDITQNSLEPVINATGIIIHTNLGRIPFTPAIIENTIPVLTSYNNLEFDTHTGTRGSRDVHVIEKIKFLTGAEDALVVNNNAAAVMLILRTFAKNKEVIISRSELVEIGGSFRMPDIMKAADCIMTEIGTTNKTKIEDYKKAINKNTGIILKVHQSNFIIKGFTASCNLQDLATLAKKNKLPLVYDLGSGLLHEQQLPNNYNEISVNKALKDGANLICFSGDKLLGGPQAGIIVGEKKYIKELRKAPLYRALRVDKLTISFLENICNTLILPLQKEQNFLYNILNQQKEILYKRAESLQQLLQHYNIKSKIIEETGTVGGGTMPETSVPSFAIQINPTNENTSQKKQSKQAETIYQQLMQNANPIIAVLKKGKIIINVLCLQDKELPIIANALHKIINS